MTEELLTFTSPVFKVEGEVKGELARDILRLEIEESTSGLKQLTAQLVMEGEPGSGTELEQHYLDGSIIDSVGAPGQFGSVFAEAAGQIRLGPCSGVANRVDAQLRQPLGSSGADTPQRCGRQRREKRCLVAMWHDADRLRHGSAATIATGSPDCTSGNPDPALWDQDGENIGPRGRQRARSLHADSIVWMSSNAPTLWL